VKLSDKAEEILESLWISVEEKKRSALDLEELGVEVNDPALTELTDRALVEIRGAEIRFRPEGKKEGRMTIRRHRLAGTLDDGRT